MNTYIILCVTASLAGRPIFRKGNGEGYTEIPFFAGVYTQPQIDAAPDFFNDGQEHIAIQLTPDGLHSIGFECSLNMVSVMRRYGKPEPPAEVNTNRELPPQVTEVRIISEPQCEIHGWTVGGVYPTIPGERNVIDDNGQDVYVMSVLRNRGVWLSSLEYELVQPAATKS